MTKDEVMVMTFGPERHGRVHGFGAGATPTDLWGSRGSSIFVHELQSKLKETDQKLQESEKKREESDAKVKSLEGKVERVEQLLAQLLGVEMANTTTHSSSSIDATIMVQLIPICYIFFVIPIYYSYS